MWRGSGPPSNPGSPAFGSREPLRREIKVRASDKDPISQGIPTHHCLCLCRHCTAMSSFCVCAGEGVPASGRFPLAFLYNVPTTAGRCSTYLLRVPLLVYVMLTDLLLFGIWCTKAMKHGHPGRDRLPMRDTLKCSRINITSKTKLSIVLTFSPEVSGRWPLWPYPQFSTIHDTLYYFIKLYNKNKSLLIMHSL